MTTINDLSVATSLSSDDKFPLWQNANGVTRSLPVSVLDGRYLTVDNVAALAASPTVETFAAGTDFTPGSSVSLTLKNQYYSAQNVEVFFDANYQGPDQYSLIGYGLTFLSPIPLGIQNVYVRGGAVRLAAAPSDGTVTDIKVASGSILASLINGIVSVERFGASAASSDNSVAVAAAIAYCAANNVTLYLPRTYKVSQKFTSSKSIRIVGQGMAQSGLYWLANSSSTGLDVTINGAAGLAVPSGLEDLSLITEQAAVGVAAKFTGLSSLSADRITPRVNVERVAVRGATNPANDGFDTGLFFDNCTGVVVDQYNFWGKVDPAGEPNYDSSFGIRYDNTINASPHPTEFSFSRCRIYYAKTLVYANDFEGGYVHHNQLVGGNAGVRLLTPGPGYPHAIVNNNHINVSDFGVVVGGMYEVQIHDNLIYKQLGTGTGVGVNVNNGAQFCNVHHNTFENLNATASMNAVIFDACQWSIAQGNIFRRTDSVDGTGHGVGVWMTPNSSNCKTITHDQIFVSTTTSQLDQGTGNTIVP